MNPVEATLVMPTGSYPIVLKTCRLETGFVTGWYLFQIPMELSPEDLIEAMHPESEPGESLGCLVLEAGIALIEQPRSSIDPGRRVRLILR